MSSYQVKKYYECYQKICECDDFGYQYIIYIFFFLCCIILPVSIFFVCRQIQKGEDKRFEAMLHRAPTLQDKEPVMRKKRIKAKLKAFSKFKQLQKELHQPLSKNGKRKKLNKKTLSQK